MNARVPVPTFPPNPTVGQVFLNWVWNGSAWVCRGAGPVSIIRVFNAAATYWPSPGLTYAMVECVGGGGGGGGCGLLTDTQGGGAGGGAGGSYSRAMLAAGLLTSGVQITIGVGGFGSNDWTGAAGGTTSFGAFCTAPGGGGGWGNQFGNSGQWGQPGWPTGTGAGDFVADGNCGGSGDATSATGVPTHGGFGGGSFFGGSPAAPWTLGGAAADGLAGRAPGAGGSGSVQHTATGVTTTGGNGADGVCVVTDYCFGDTSIVQDCGCGPGVGDPCAPCPPGGQGWWTPNW